MRANGGGEGEVESARSYTYWEKIKLLVVTRNDEPENRRTIGKAQAGVAPLSAGYRLLRGLQ